MYIGIYGASSIQRLTDFLRAIYELGGGTPVIIKPVGAAAQIGVPEAHKTAYRLGKPLIVLPSIRDLAEIFKPARLLYVDAGGKTIDAGEIGEGDAIILPGGELEPGRDEMLGVEEIVFRGIPPRLPAPVLAGLILFIRGHG